MIAPGARSSVATVRLAVVLVVVVAVVVLGVQPEAVLGRVVGIVGIRARPAVAMAHVDDDRCPGDRRLDLGPGGVRAVDLDHVRRVLDRLGVRLVGIGSIARRRIVRRPDDDHDLRVGERGARRRHRDAKADDEGEGEERRRSCATRAPGWTRGLVDLVSLVAGRRATQSRDGPDAASPSVRARCGAGRSGRVRVRRRRCASAPPVPRAAGSRRRAPTRRDGRPVCRTAPARRPRRPGRPRRSPARRSRRTRW